ncbi:L-fucose/L-arabinose isomerase family protein [Clostridium oceanicum]|uniref:L-fucose/L-arabinose isomerase family protein n=1 Tax=Clostridium oceanicum TaxID=1543 RepID=A0ABN1JM09_9CLOT
MKLNVGLISVGYPNFRVDIAKENLDETVNILKELDLNLIYSNEVSTNIEDTDNFIKEMKLEDIDLIIIQNGTFADGNHIIKITEKFKNIPILLWGFPEPKAGEYNYIAINSMTGFNMYTSFLYKLKIPFNYVFGRPSDEKVINKVKNNIKALQVKKKLENSKFCIIGGRAPGFYLSSVDEMRYRKEVGPEIIYYSIASLLKDASNLDKERVENEINVYKSQFKIKTTNEAIEKSARVYLVIKDFMKENNVDAFTIKCWPEMQEIYNFAPCVVLSRLNSEGVMVACEGDVPGLTTMYIENLLTEKSIFFADLVNINENGTAKLWHCGCAPYKLACKNKEVSLTEHPTIKNGIGMSTEFEMTKGRVSMCKLKEDKDKYKFFVASGESVTEDRKVTGNQMDIKFDSSNEDLLNCIVKNGIEHHYAIVQEDIKDKLEILCKWMNIDIVEPS